ncbi:hypothetical protein LCGC14_1117950 [marine sediment metagenome]|uniref:Uncharacterized protein n=1 Tax=marine sediment metagenome TaxID=412755 RepID=A0A0F9M4S3_9ZZZZ
MTLKTQDLKTKEQVRAIALLSGGLDSRLAVKMMLEQGIELKALNFVTSFCTCTAKSSCCSEAKKATDEYGIEMKVINSTKELIEAVKNPKHGYGRGLNPCLDCRISMFKTAKKIMEEEGASFIVTGEVLGERPMSQRLDAINIIERDSGLKGKLLRPLSAKLFEPTDVEKKGIVDRDALLAIRGRGRKPQIKLAEDLGIKDYPCPAGGCLLTDISYSQKLKRLLAINEFPTNKQLALLRVGRHFDIDGNMVAIGRDEAENKRIEVLKEPGDTILECSGCEGPTTIIKGGDFSDEIVRKAASLTARYSQGRGAEKMAVVCVNKNGQTDLKVNPKDGFKLAETLTNN